MIEYWNGALDLDASSIFILVITICAFLVPIIIILPPVPMQKSDALVQTHYKAGLEPSKSNLKARSTQQGKLSSGKTASVQGLMIYPVTSCKGIEVSKAKVLPGGLEFDRLFTFAQLRSPFPVSVDSSTNEKNGHKWEAITLQQFARLAAVTVELWLPDDMKLRKQSLRTRESFLILRFPWKELGWRGLLATVAAKLTNGLKGVPEMEILLPVDFPGKVDIEEFGYSYDDISISKDTVSALNMSNEIPEALRLYLGVSNKLGLFRIDPAQWREVYKSASSKKATGNQPVVSFQDAYPLHIINLASYQKLTAEAVEDEALKQSDVLDFRPNIILSESSTYDENDWRKIRLIAGSSGLYNDMPFDVSSRTAYSKLPDGAEGAPKSCHVGLQGTPLFEEALSEEDRQGWVGVGMEVVVE